MRARKRGNTRGKRKSKYANKEKERSQKNRTRNFLTAREGRLRSKEEGGHTEESRRMSGSKCVGIGGTTIPGLQAKKGREGGKGKGGKLPAERNSGGWGIIKGASTRGVKLKEARVKTLKH